VATSSQVSTVIQSRSQRDYGFARSDACRKKVEVDLQCAMVIFIHPTQHVSRDEYNRLDREFAGALKGKASFGFESDRITPISQRTRKTFGVQIDYVAAERSQRICLELNVGTSSPTLTTCRSARQRNFFRACVAQFLTQPLTLPTARRSANGYSR